MKRKKVNLVLIIVFMIGFGILSYPFITQYWNAKVQSKAIASYGKMLENIEVKDYDELFEKGRIYNEQLLKLSFPLVEYRKVNGYNELFNINNNGMIGYITINKINVELPIYHGTNSSVLNRAVGHMEGTSLPIGGLGTHSVLSAHSGLPTAKLFTNLGKLEVNDIFTITILNQTLTYQIDEIKIVEPSDVSHLEIVPSKDYVTLITCTPYGINTHRLLVRGTRISNIVEREIVISSDAYQIDKLMVTFVISIPILGGLIIFALIKPVKRKIEVGEI